MPNLVAPIIAQIQAQHPGAVVHERQRRGLVMALGGNRYAAEYNLGAIHYGPNADQEIDTTWEAIAESAWQYRMVRADYTAYARSVLNSGDLVQYSVGAEWVAFQPLALNWTNQDNSRQQLAQPQAVAAQATDDVLYWPDGYGAGRHFRYQTQGTRLDKRLIIDSLAALPTPAVTGEIWLELGFILKNSAGVDLWLDGVRWARTNGVRVRTANRIEFRNVTTDAVLWYLDYPSAWDANNERVVGQFEVRRQAGTYYLTVRIPRAWVETAVFPITIDPTVDATVGASADDSWQTDAGSNGDPTNGSGSFRGDTAGGYRKYVAARWAVTGPASGDTIDVAYSSWMCGGSGQVMNANAYCQAADSAGQFTTDVNDISGRSVTAGAAWNAAVSTFAYANSASMITPVQAVINRASWASGNYLAVILVAASATDTCNISTYDASSSWAPKLHVEYTAAAALTAALSGAGSLSAAQPASTVPVAATLSGAGSLSVTTSAILLQVAASLSGAGSLSAAQPVVVSPAVVSLSGAGSLSATEPAATIPVVASLSGVGSLNATPVGTQTLDATASLSGAGALAAAQPISISPVVASLAGTGSLSASEPSATVPAVAALSGTGTLNATPVGAQTLDATAALSGAGSLSASQPISLVPVIATLSGAGLLVASEPISIVPAVASLAGTGSLSATTAALPLDAVASLSGAGSLSAAQPVAISPAVASLSGAGALSAAQPTSIVPAAAVLTGTGTAQATANQTHQASAALSGVGSLSATATPAPSVTTAERVPAGSWINAAEYLRESPLALPRVAVAIPLAAHLALPDLVALARAEQRLALSGGLNQPTTAAVLTWPALDLRASPPVLRRTSGAALAADARLARRQLVDMQEEMAALREELAAQRARGEEEMVGLLLLGPFGSRRR